MLEKAENFFAKQYASLNGFDLDSSLRHCRILKQCTADILEEETQKGLWGLLIRAQFNMIGESDKDKEAMMVLLLQITHRNTIVIADELSYMTSLAPYFMGYISKALDASREHIRTCAWGGKLTAATFLFALDAGLPETPKRISSYAAWVWEYEAKKTAAEGRGAAETKVKTNEAIEI